GEGSDAEAADVLAQEDGALDIHDDRLRPLHHETIGSRNARTVEKGIDRDRVGSGLGRLEIDMGEVRELLVPAEDRHVDGEAAGRETVLVELADGPEIGGAQEGDPVVLAPVEPAVAGLLEAES